MRGQGRRQRRQRRQRRRGQFLHVSRFLEPTLGLLHHLRPSHGYTLLERLAESGMGSLDPGVVYRALRDMEGRGWVVSLWDAERAQGPPRRVYRLTAQGAQVLNASMQDLQRARSQIDTLVDAYQRHMQEGDGEHHDRE